MSAFDDMTKSIRDVYKRLAISGKRAAAVTRLRLELSGLDRERRDLYSSLGQKINDLRLSGSISHQNILGVLETDFEKVDRVGRKIEDTMEAIRNLSIDTDPESKSGQEKEKPEEHLSLPEGGNSENLLDSFGVR